MSLSSVGHLRRVALFAAGLVHGGPWSSDNLPLTAMSWVTLVERRAAFYLLCGVSNKLVRERTVLWFPGLRFNTGSGSEGSEPPPPASD